MKAMKNPSTEFGARLRALREAQGLQQDALGALVDVKGSAVSKWEVGRVFPSHRYLERLCVALGATYSDLGLAALEGMMASEKVMAPVAAAEEQPIIQPAPQQVVIDIPQPATVAQPPQPQGALPSDVQAAIDTILRMPWDARETVVTLLRLSLERQDYEKRLIHQLAGGGRS